MFFSVVESFLNPFVEKLGLGGITIWKCIVFFLDIIKALTGFSLAFGFESGSLFLNFFLAVIPSTTSVGGGDSNLNSGNDDSCKESSNSVWAE